MADHAFQLPNGKTLHRTCSIGFTLYPFLPETPDRVGWEQCVGLADTGLYLAKESGRDRWVGVEAGGTAWSESPGMHDAIRADPAGAVSRDWVRLVRQEH